MYEELGDGGGDMQNCELKFEGFKQQNSGKKTGFWRNIRNKKPQKLQGIEELRIIYNYYSQGSQIYTLRLFFI